MSKMYKVKTGKLLSVEGGLVPQKDAIVIWKRLNSQKNQGNHPFTDLESKLYDALTAYLMYASMVVRVETYGIKPKKTS